MSSVISCEKCKSLKLKSLSPSLLRQGDTMEVVLNEILPPTPTTDISQHHHLHQSVLLTRKDLTFSTSTINISI